MTDATDMVDAVAKTVTICIEIAHPRELNDERNRGGNRDRIERMSRGDGFAGMGTGRARSVMSRRGPVTVAALRRRESGRGGDNH